MNKILFLIFVLTGLVTYSQEIDKEQLKKEIREELKAELQAEIKKQDSVAKKEKRFDFLSDFSLKGYGVVNYYNNDWDKDTGDPDRRNYFDAERLNLYLMYDFTPNIQFKTEIEFEHGGTGTTMELDVLEEFGEFEQEVEKGGEVKIDQMNILFKYKPWLNFRVGRVKLYMGNASELDRPTQYVTGYRSKMENTIIPIGWYENGIEILGDIGKNKQWSYKFFFVNGLNSEEFSSQNWIKRGHQEKFEVVNAENFAVSFRFDRNFANNSYVGLSGYFGNSNQNRSKQKLDDVKGNVSIIDAHTNLDFGDFKFRGMFLYGHLQNADKITDANRNLQNALEAKKTDVAESALGYYASAMYNVLPLINKTAKDQLFLFARYDFYDTMHTTKTGYYDNPRWERSEFTFGANYFITPKIVFKGHYSINTLGVKSNENKEKVFLLGLGFNIN